MAETGSSINTSAFPIGTHLNEQDGQSQMDEKTHDTENDTFAQSAAECTRIMDELQKLKSRLVINLWIII
jgi:hypothetical protein